MQVTREGLGLIKRFEGFRGRAYRCPAGIWTIGYGHTAAAGPPAVAAGQELSVAEAEAILQRDVAKFARGVSGLLHVELQPQQFSALVSFAYNVGLANFRASSVLKAVNARDFAAVPQRLQLWTKAGGRTLPGLARRRAAEAELFCTGSVGEEVPSPGSITARRGKPLHRSSTVLSAILSAIAGVAALFSQPAGTRLPWPVAAVLLLAMLGAAAWIVRERYRKSIEEGL